MALACCQRLPGPLRQHRQLRRQQQPRGARRSVCAAAGAAGGTGDGTQALLELLEGTDRGLDTPPERAAAILSEVARLRSEHSGESTTSPSALSATWRLLWTTEKETLFIIKNAGLFGTRAGDVFQVIDVSDRRLQNVITFPPSGAFIVDSSIEVEGPQRVSFKFTGAKLKTASRDWGVPPFGQGWFDTVFCDGAVRIAQDIRGDTLVVANDGPPRIFT